MTTETTTARPNWKTPKMRRTQPVGIIHSGGNQTIYDCAICGDTHTVATRNRGTTKHERELFAAHNAPEHEREVQS